MLLMLSIVFPTSCSVEFTVSMIPATGAILCIMYCFNHLVRFGLFDFVLFEVFFFFWFLEIKSIYSSRYTAIDKYEAMPVQAMYGQKNA